MKKLEQCQDKEVRRQSGTLEDWKRAHREERGHAAHVEGEGGKDQTGGVQGLL